MPAINTSIYFDNNATTMLSPSVRKYLRKTLRKKLGNPSSPHSYSNASKAIIDKSRSQISSFLNCSSDSLIFTSGATEGNTMVFHSFLEKPGNKTVITTISEHSSVKKNINALERKGITVVCLDIDNKGLIDIEEYKRALDTSDKKLVSIAWANSETGVLQDIPKLLSLAKEKGSLFHTDASQAICRIPIDLKKVPVDFLTFTGHKFHAPKGIGAIYAQSGKDLKPLLLGGSQEHGYRAGTENVSYIGALGEAISDRSKSFKKIASRLEYYRNTFEELLFKEDIEIAINGIDAPRVPNTCNILFKGLLPQSLLGRLDNVGVYCSQTSACTSMIPEPSRTLREMGLSNEEAFSSYRFSFAQDNSIRQINKAVKIITREVKHLRKNSIWSEE